MTNFYFCDKLLSVNKFAGVTQWQSSSFPSWLRGFDSLHPLHYSRITSCFYFGFGNPLFEIGRLFATSVKFSLSHRKSPALFRPLGALGSFPFTRSTLAGFIPAFILGLGILCSKLVAFSLPRSNSPFLTENRLRCFAHWARLALFPSPAPL